MSAAVPPATAATVTAADTAGVTTDTAGATADAVTADSPASATAPTVDSPAPAEAPTVPSAAPAKAVAAADPGADMRLVGGCGPLRRRLRPDVIAVQRRAVGRVLDLRGPLGGGFAYENPHELVVASLPALADRAETPFDTVCSFGALAAAPAAGEFLAGLRAVMAPESRLLFVELDGDARRWRRVLDVAARRLWAIPTARDISGILWRGGFEVVSIQRHPLRIGGMPLLRYVVGAARPAPDGRGTV